MKQSYALYVFLYSYWFQLGVVMYDIRRKRILNSNSRKILFVHNIRFSRLLVFKFCTEYGNIGVVLCAKSQNDVVTKQ